MATNEERMKILKMIQEGKITAEEGAKLLAALRDSRKGGASGPRVSLGGNRGWVRVRVTDMASGKTKVNINLPLGLMEAGLNIGAQYAPELMGVDLDQVVNEVRSGGAAGKIIDVIDEEDGEHVEIFIE